MAQPGLETAPLLLPEARTGRVGRRTVPCEVWIADVEVERPAHLALLDGVERGRRERYHQDVDRTRFTVAAALLRLVVAAETGVEPGSVQVDRSCPRCGAPHGKPRIPGTDVHVSVSHSGSKVALALTRAAPVGVDVESIVERDVAGLSRSVLGGTEAMSRTEDFYTYWCRKEAVVKATGDGLQVPLVEVVVSAADAPASLVSYRGTPLVVSMCDLPIDSGYAAALAVLAEGQLEVRIHDAVRIMSTL